MAGIFGDISLFHVDSLLASTHGAWHASGSQEALDE